MNVIHPTSGSNTLGVGKVTVTTNVATPMPIRFAMINRVRMTWMRTRRRR
jgi:hypothetical protein